MNSNFAVITLISSKMCRITKENKPSSTYYYSEHSSRETTWDVKNLLITEQMKICKGKLTTIQLYAKIKSIKINKV